MKNITKISLLFFIIVLLCIVGSIIFIGIPNKQSSQTIQEIIPDITKDTRQLFKSSNVTNISNEDIDKFNFPQDPVPNAEPYVIVRPEYKIGLNALKKAVATNWDGRPFSLSIKLSDLDQDLIHKLYTEEQNKKRDIKYMPKDLNPIYSDINAQKEINDLIKIVYDEYVNFLSNYNVNERYINELTNITITPENIKYKGDRDSNEWTYTEPINEYYTCFMQITDNNVYLNAQDIINSGIIGSIPEAGSTEFYNYHKVARNIALRWIMYHELTHALQISYIHINAGDNWKAGRRYWQSSDRLLSNVASKYFWNWGFYETFGKGNFNRIVGDEAVADGVGLIFIKDFYHFNSKQEKLFFDYLSAGERLSIVKEDLEKMRDIYKEYFPNTEPRIIGTELKRIFRDVKDKALKDFLIDYVANRLSNERGIPRGVGYANALTGDDMDILWDVLNN